MDESKVRKLFWLLAVVLLAATVFVFLLSAILGLVMLALVALVLTIILAASTTVHKAVVTPIREGKENMMKPGTQIVKVGQQIEYQLQAERHGKLCCWPINKKEFVIGRDPGCDLVIARGNEVSGKHCRIIYWPHSKTYYIEDLGSKNGTFLGSRRLELNKQEKLLENAQINVAGITYRFVKIKPRKA